MYKYDFKGKQLDTDEEITGYLIQCQEGDCFIIPHGLEIGCEGENI